MSAEIHKYIILDRDSRLATRPKVPITDPPLILPNGLWEFLLQLRYQHSWTGSFLSLQNSRIASGKLPRADSQNVRPAVKVPLDKAVQRIGRLISKGIRSGNQENIQCLLSAFLRRSADLVRDGGINAQSYLCSTVLEFIGPSLADVEDFHGNGAGFERCGEHDEVGEEFFGERAEDVDRGQVEELDFINEENTDAGCGFGRHC